MPQNPHQNPHQNLHQNPHQNPRSKHADVFNHDPWAHDYDQDVKNSRDPIRQGYETCLEWVAQQADLQDSDHVLELGSGTGNLTRLLTPHKTLTCVDISVEMTRLAREKVTSKVTGKVTGTDKVTGTGTVHFVHADVLEHLHQQADISFDKIVSTYTLHHLIETEKTTFLQQVKRVLRPGGRLVVGDLMVADEAARAEKMAFYRQQGDNSTAHALEEEFFWQLELTLKTSDELGFEHDVQRFSDLSFGLLAVNARD